MARGAGPSGGADNPPAARDDAARSATRGGTGSLVSLASLSCVLWGSAVPMVRLGYRAFGIGPGDTGSQMLFAGLRFVLAGACVTLAWCAINRSARLPRRGELRVMASVALFQTFGQYLLYYMGLSRATGVNGSLMQGFGVFAALVMSALVFRLERLTGRKLLGCAIGFAGIMVAGMGERAVGGAGFHLDGEGLLLLSTVSASAASSILRRHASEVDPVLVCGWQFMMGGTALLAVGLALGGSLAPAGAGGAGILAWLVMVSAVAYGVWSHLLRSHDVSQVAVFEFLIPVFGVLLSLAILGPEGTSVGPHTAVALALISVGIYVVESRPSKARARG